MENILVKCPQCSDLVIINKKDFNCKIFRHGVYKKDNKQIDPHLNKQECDRLFNEKLIYGCGKPFRIIKTAQEQYTVEECGYI